MPSAVERLLGFRYLGARRAEGFISVISGFSLIGIMLAVGTLIVVMSVMTGFRHELLRQLGSVSGQLLAMGGRGAPVLRDPQIEKQLAGIQGVASVAAIVEGRGLAVGNGGARGVLVRGMEPGDLRKLAPLARGIEGAAQERSRARDYCGESAGGEESWGSLQQFDRGEGVIVGRRMAELLGLKLGDELMLVSSQVRATPLGMLPRTAKFRIEAFFCVGMYDFDANFVFLPLEQAQLLFDQQGYISSLQIFLNDPTRFREMYATVRQVLTPDYFLTDWINEYGGFFAAVEAQTNVLFVVLLLIVLVAAFNIVSGLTMLARTKTTDIAILRTMGARRGTILRTFLLVGGMIGGFGTLLGTVAGILFAVNIEAVRRFIQRLLDVELFDPQMRLLAEIPSRIDPTTVIAIAVVSLLFALLATLVPAWRASRLDPIEGLRRE